MEPFASIVAREVKFYATQGESQDVNTHDEASHLRGNELETGVLPPCLLVDDVLHFRVHL